MNVVVERCAFLDVHRDTVMACARTPDGEGGRREEVVQFGTTVSQLTASVRERPEPSAIAFGADSPQARLGPLGGRSRGLRT